MWKYLHSRLPVIMYKYVRWRGKGRREGERRGKGRGGKGREGEERGEGRGRRRGEGRRGEGRRGEGRSVYML